MLRKNPRKQAKRLNKETSERPTRHSPNSLHQSILADSEHGAERIFSGKKKTRNESQSQRFCVCNSQLAVCECVFQTLVYGFIRIPSRISHSISLSLSQKLYRHSQLVVFGALLLFPVLLYFTTDLIRIQQSATLLPKKKTISNSK